MLADSLSPSVTNVKYRDGRTLNAEEYPIDV